MSGFVGQIGVPNDPAANDRKIHNAGRVSYPAFIATLGTLFAVAVLTVAARVSVRLYTRRRLYLDDCFLIFGLICLSGATGLTLTFVRNMFISEALRLDPTVVVRVDQLLALTNSMAVVDSFLALAWTAIFSVKFCFLALFRLLIRQVSKKLTVYYWCVVGFTVTTWAFLVSEGFILCPYFGAETAKCLPEPPRVLSLALTSFITILDIFTDIMIISIPILLLRKAQMKDSQKLVLSAFLCLSVAMIMAAITRLSGYRLNGVLDLTWGIFWQYLEACIAVIMGSVTAFRALSHSRGSGAFEKGKKAAPYFSHERLLQRRKKHNDSGWEGLEHDRLPEIPSPMFTGIRTFIRRNNRHPGSTTAAATTTMMQSGLNPSYDDDIEDAAPLKATNQILVHDRIEVHSTKASVHHNPAISRQSFL